MTIQEYDSLVENYINGNISTVKDAIKLMDKYELISFLKYWIGNSSTPEHEVIDTIYKLLQ